MFVTILVLCCFSANTLAEHHRRSFFGRCRDFTPKQATNFSNYDSISNTTWKIVNTTDFIKSFEKFSCPIYKFSTPINGTSNTTCSMFNFSSTISSMFCSGKAHVLAADDTYLVTYQCISRWWIFHTDYVNVFKSTTAPSNATSSILTKLPDILAENNLSDLIPKYKVCASKKKHGSKKHHKQ